MATYEDSSSSRGTSGTGAHGESSGDGDGYFIALSPPSSSTPDRPKEVFKEESRHYGGGSSSSQSQSVSHGPAIGIDQFGNVVYEDLPAIPPVYRAYYDLNPGWNTRATILEPIGPTCYFSFKAGFAVGAIVGLTKTPNAQAGYEDILLGFMVLNGVAHIISEGVILYSIPSATAEPDPGAYNRLLDSLVIKKTLSKVEFFLSSLDGQNGETKIGESVLSEPVTYISAALYLGGDVVSSEILEYPDVLAGEMPSLSGGFYESASASYLLGLMPLLAGSFYENDYSVMNSSLPALGGFMGDTAASFMLSSLPSLTGELYSTSDDELVPEFNFTFADLPSLNGAFLVRDVTFGTLGGSLPSLGGFIADENVSILQGESPALQGLFYEQQYANRFTFVSFAYSAGKMFSRETSYVVLNSVANVVAVFTLDSIESMRLESAASASVGFTLTDIIYQLLASTMSAGDVASLQRDGMSVWAFHMDSNGSTRYEGYDFNSYMTIGDDTYGVNASGIHKLGGRTDNGALIPASVDFGSLNFGTNSRKAMPYVYVGMSSTGKTVLKIESDGGTYLYTARDSTTLMKAHRFELGRGLESTMYGVSLTTTGDAFDLQNIEFQPITLKRSL